MISADKNIVLPIAYNHIVQGFIYCLLDPALRRFLHNEGYAYEKRQFKLFTFSRLSATMRIVKDSIALTPPVRLAISSPKHEILQSLAEGFFNKEKYVLGKNDILVESISVLPMPDFSKPLTAKMLSPWTMYSTVTKADGRKWTQYYEPFDEEGQRLLVENLRKKYEVIYGNTEDFQFSFMPFKVNFKNRQVVKFRKFNNDREQTTTITAWNGLYNLDGSPSALELSYDTGIGAKNSMGFGMWEVYGGKEEG